ncbi:MAG: hydantoinase/oxoprolinase family protein [Dehalococcoidia bacterium]|nr:hydantoinase/oxoprolinase family protein [Dehalococcoidia bacterium]
MIPAEDASMKPVTLINSGPVGGVTACGYFSKLLGEPNIIGIDMGGTSLDVSMVTQGEYSATLVSRVNNHNIFVPMVDVYSIGAGGGSIAWIDMGTRLKVGPNSAGADPGPACYNLGGEEPAVTDADVVLGRINPGYFLGGDMPLSAEKAAAAIKEKIADPMGMTVTQAAAGICQIVDAKMADAIRVVTVEKGYDPRDYALLAFGGAGPVHASALAYELGIKKIIVPFLATAQSAFGIVASDIVHNLVITDVMELSETEKINERFDKLETDGRKMLEGEDVLPEHVEIKRYADIRYKGQAHEVTIPVPAKSLDAAALSELADSFETRYISLFGPGTAFKEAGLEMVSMRVDATGKTKKPAMPEYPLQGKDSSPALKGERQVVMDYRAGFVNVKTYDGAKLNCGNSFPGPAVVEYPGTTVVMLSGQKSTVDKYKNLVIEWEG